MEREVGVRPAISADLDNLMTLQQLCAEASRWTRSDYAALLGTAGGLLWLAESGAQKQVAGFIAGRVLGDEMEILNLAVAPAQRRRGLGRRLGRDRAPAGLLQ